MLLHTCKSIKTYKATVLPSSSSFTFNGVFFIMLLRSFFNKKKKPTEWKLRGSKYHFITLLKIMIFFIFFRFIWRGRTRTDGKCVYVSFKQCRNAYHSLCKDWCFSLFKYRINLTVFVLLLILRYKMGEDLLLLCCSVGFLFCSRDQMLLHI